MRAAAKPDMFVAGKPSCVELSVIQAEISCNITKWTLGVQKHLQNNAFNGTWRKHGGAKHACCHISALVPFKASEGVWVHWVYARHCVVGFIFLFFT